MFEWLQSLAIDEPSAKATAAAGIPAGHPFLADHFPGHPLLPGSLQIERGAQVAGPLVEEIVARRAGAERFAFLGMVRNATFHAPVVLPAALRIAVHAARVERDSAVVLGELTDATETVECRVDLVMM